MNSKSSANLFKNKRTQIHKINNNKKDKSYSRN